MWLGIESGIEFRAEKFKMEDHGVEWILYFVRDARGNPIECRKFGREIELVFQALQCFVIAECQESAGGLPAVFENL
jgi:hypothetical protein